VTFVVAERASLKLHLGRSARLLQAYEKDFWDAASQEP
jgi:hypothetical protein